MTSPLAGGTSERVNFRALLLTVSAAALVALAGPACGKTGGDKAAEARKALRSKDGRFEVTVPLAWHLQPGMSLEANIEAEGPEGFIVVITQPKAEVADSNLPRYAASRAEVIAKKVDQGKVGAPLETTVTGHRAIQIDVSGVTKGQPVMYVLTVVETASHLHQVLAWTTRSKFPKSQATLAAITATFGETTPGL